MIIKIQFCERQFFEVHNSNCILHFVQSLNCDAKFSYDHLD